MPPRKKPKQDSETEESVGSLLDPAFSTDEEDGEEQQQAQQPRPRGRKRTPGKEVDEAELKKEENRRKKTKMIRVSDAVYEQLSQISVVLREDRRAVVEKLITNCFKNLEARQQVHRSVKLSVKGRVVLPTEHKRSTQLTEATRDFKLKVVGAPPAAAAARGAPGPRPRKAHPSTAPAALPQAEQHAAEALQSVG
jgi:predicted transcriptional regulator